MAAYLGIDVGTSSVKLSVVDEAGCVIASVSKDYVIQEPHPGWREIDPYAWWDAVCAGCRALQTRIPLGSVEGVGVTGQMHTVVCLDGANRPVGPSIMWNDQRTIDEVASARNELERIGEHALARRISTGSPAINLAWMKKHASQAFASTKTFIGVPDWIALQLGAPAATDWCGASVTSLFDISRNAWSYQACEALGIPERILPMIEDADCVAGSLSAEAAEATGLPVGIAIVRGTGDNPASAIPTGCLVHGTPTISLGTSGVLMYAERGVVDPAYGKPVLFRAQDELSTLVQLSVRSCGSNRQWWNKSILRCKDFELEDRRVAQLDHDMRNLFFYPHLNGEKVLHADPYMRGAFLGLDLDTTRSELCRALMEGIAFALRSLRDVVEKHEDWGVVSLVGGGSKSDLWTQIISCVLNVPVVRLRTSGAGQGAAMLALSAVTGEKLAVIVERSIQRIDEVFPEQSISARYDERYEVYQRIYGALREIYA